MDLMKFARHSWSDT